MTTLQSKGNASRIPTNSGIGSRLFFATVLSLAGFAAPLLVSAADNSRQWRLEVAPSYRGSMNTEVTGTSHSQDVLVASVQPYRYTPQLAAEPATDLPPTDSILTLGNRDFLNGYVHTDEITQFDGATVNFGYRYDSQYDSGAETLAFYRMPNLTLAQGQEIHKTIQTNMDKDIVADDNFGGGGLKINALYDLPSWNGLGLSLLAGLRGYPSMNSTVNTSNFQQTVEESRTSYKDIYTGAYIDNYLFHVFRPPPGAPYSNPDGNPGSDPLITNYPVYIDRDYTHNGVTKRYYGQRQVTTWEARNQIAVDIDVDLYQFALGGCFSYDLGSNFALSMRPSLLINFVDFDVTRDEQFVAYYSNGEREILGRWHAQESEEKVLIGAAIEAGIDYQISETWFTGISAGYEWIDKTSVDIDLNSVNIDLSGFTASFVVGVRF